MKSSQAKRTSFFNLSIECRSRLISSNNDLYCSYASAQHLARTWGAELSDAGESGHINIASGQGPWPEGLLQFGKFLRNSADMRRRPQTRRRFSVSPIRFR